MTTYSTARTSSIGQKVAFALLLSLLLAGMAPRTLAAASGAEPVVTAIADDEAIQRRIYIGMWTLHLRDLDRGIENNWVLGLSWGKVYGATFINSFGNRSYTAGIQGTVKEWNPSLVALGVGYRAGLITGYDERFIPLAGKIPVLPLVQPLLRVDGRRLGLELSYSGIIASGALNVRF